MNKKQLITAIAALSTALSIESATDGLEVKELEALHTDLETKKAAADKAALENEKTKTSLSNQEVVVLKFKAPYKRYCNGDIAGFSGKVAEHILSLKPSIAVVHSAESTEE